MSAEECIFCKIAKKEAPASLVYEDDTAMAFMDLYPISDGHTLIIPKKHYANIYAMPDQEVAHLYTIAKKVAVAVKKSIKPDGISITQHNEPGAGQDVFHMHIHVIPRYQGQRLPRFEELKEAGRQKLDEVAGLIRQNL
ncbi:MAG: HIT domain-containing protein [Candidatus Bathyarchaeia archaeon]